MQFQSATSSRVIISDLGLRLCFFLSSFLGFGVCPVFPADVERRPRFGAGSPSDSDSDGELSSVLSSVSPSSLCLLRLLEPLVLFSEVDNNPALRPHQGDAQAATPGPFEPIFMELYTLSKDESESNSRERTGLLCANG